MIVRNKSNRLFTVTDKDFQAVCLKPNDVVEVDDAEGRGYLANYGDILEKVESAKIVEDKPAENISKPTDEVDEKEDETSKEDEAEQSTAEDEKSAETSEKDTAEDKGDEGEGAEGAEGEASKEDDEVEQLVAFLRANGMPLANRQWSVEKLRENKVKIEANKAEDKPAV